MISQGQRLLSSPTLAEPLDAASCLWALPTVVVAAFFFLRWLQWWLQGGGSPECAGHRSPKGAPVREELGAQPDRDPKCQRDPRSVGSGMDGGIRRRDIQGTAENLTGE
ncbi:unnamed protein product [Prorocentrum cordatum]|uniref:Uncharacterized protein n=1 Tax=Prorocentrum cordatum TaxID=2364126 RepID=A0ABN9XC03_9DINO|nr:unnamed protein product [Polarella glacialis]